MTKRKTINRLRNDAADLLQKLVRLKAADANGYCRCVTCGKQAHWKEMHGGHFIERGKAATKLLEENIHPQCPGCNTYRMKNATTVLEYRQYMVDMYGEDYVKWLESESRKAVKQSRPELESMIQELKERVREHENEAV